MSVPAPVSVPVSRRIPTDWEGLVRVSLGLVLVYLAVCVGRLVFVFHETSTLVGLVGLFPSESGAATIRSLSDTDSLFSVGQIFAGLAYLFGYVLLVRKVRRTLTEFAGIDPRPTFRHWTNYLWTGAVLLTLALSLVHPASVDLSGYDPDPVLGYTDAPFDAAAAADQLRHFGALTELAVGARILSVGVLVVAILSLRGRVRATLRAAV